MGQREFSWGYVFCHMNMLDLRNWLIVTYILLPVYHYRSANSIGC
jgi:hypothetical protein